MKVSTDQALPGVSIALDLDVLLPHLRRALAAAGESIEPVSGTIVDVQYRPGDSCVLMYRLKIRRGSGGRGTRRLFSAEVLRAGERPSPLPPEVIASYASYRRKVVGAAALELPEAGIVVCPFPVDARMPWLVEAADASKLKHHLNEAFRGRDLKVRRAAVSVLGYTPRSRATFSFDLAVEHRGSGEVRTLGVIGKSHFYKPPDRLFANAWSLWRAAKGAIRLPEPLGYIAPLHMTLQERVPGERLTQLAGSTEFIPLVRETARTIAAVHSLSFPLASVRTPQDEAKVIHRWVGVLAAIRPDLRSRIERLGQRLVALLDQLAVTSGPVHGDFHPANVLSDGQGVTLIDLDEMAYGDSLLDVGRFLASLRVSALRLYDDPAGLAEAEAAFLDEYLTRGRDARLEQRARLFEATSLLIAAAAPFRLQREGWEASATLLIEEAERISERIRPGASVAVPGEISSMGVEERLEWASDCTYVQTLLDPYVRDAYAADITACEVGRIRSSATGYRIRYRLSGLAGGKRWKAILQGLLRRDGGGRGLSKRLASLRKSLATIPDAPELPKPLAHLRALGMLVLEAPRGTRLSAIMDTPAATTSARQLGRSLAILHATGADLGKVRTLDDEAAALKRRVRAMKGATPRQFERVMTLFAKWDRRRRLLPRRLAPSLRSLSPQFVFLSDRGIALAGIEELALADPLTDVGSFVAHLEMDRRAPSSAVDRFELVGAFREGYQAAGGNLDNTEIFEAGALLRLCATLPRVDSPEDVLDSLLEATDSRLNS